MLPMLAAFDFELRQRVHERGADQGRLLAIEFLDRKSTRLNSSHSQISYAVFCLKKKKTKSDTAGPWRTWRASSPLRPLRFQSSSGKLWSGAFARSARSRSRSPTRSAARNLPPKR